MSQKDKVFKGAISAQTSFAINSLPKKNTLISNLLKREDELSLAVRDTPKGIEIYWDTIKVVHKKASKELCTFLSKEELGELFYNPGKVLLKENIGITLFKLEVYLPSKNKK